MRDPKNSASATVTTENNAMGTILEESLNEIFIFAAETLKFIQVNKGARQNLGYSMDELREMTPVDIKPEHTNESFMQAIAPLVNREQQKIEFNTVHQRKNGSTYSVEVHLQIMQLEEQPVFVAMILDTTERIKIDSELAQAYSFLESAPDAMVIADQDGEIQVANRQMSKLFGYTYDELLGLNVDELVPMRYRGNHAEHRADYSAAPRVRGMGADLDLSAVTKDGREIPIEVSLSPIKTANGTLVAAAIRDVTARKEAEEALKRSEAELRLAKEMAEQATATKSRFLAAASHDLRQPLQALRLYLSALGTKIDDPKAKQLSEKMHLSLDTMGELLESLLDISSMESGSIKAEKRDVHLSEILDRLIAANAPQAHEKGLGFDCNAADFILHTDPALLERIVENFITNAIRYTSEGSISIGATQQGDKVSISITDTGLGIPEEELESVFDEYYQLDNSVRDRSKGLGLGLSIVKHIARILDHEVKAASVADKGSTFSVEVPLGDSVALENTQSEQVNVHKVKELEPTILMIDDDPTIIDAMSEVMDTFGVSVTTAKNGIDALAHIKSGLHPDMLVSDYRMPKMNGVEAVQAIRDVMKLEIPAVIMTGDTSAQDIKDVKMPNCTVLNKPIDMSQLLSLIDSIKT